MMLFARCSCTEGTAVLGKVLVPLEPELQEWLDVNLFYWRGKGAQQ